MFVRCIGTGSSGNCYALYDNDGKILLLDLGLTRKQILKGIDFNVTDVVGAVVSHEHGDHAKSVKDFENMGIPVFKPYIGKWKMAEMDRHYPTYYGKRTRDFKVFEFDMTDKNNRFMHTNNDGSECPCYGFLIEHEDMGKLLYITDTELVKWRFSGINHILISCNYQNKYISDSAKRNHVLRGHMELETVKDFIKANKSNALRTVILCHLSGDSANPDECLSEVQKVVGEGVNVVVAETGKEVGLSLYPF